MDFYNIEIEEQDGRKTTLNNYKGKVLLIVNTATGCGFTPQYEGLENMYKKYKEKGFEVLDFPCNQFGNQAPGSDIEINEFCTLNYNTSFKRFKKIDVNGKNEAPIFAYLKKAKGGLLSKDIKWNFTKFLVDKDGKVVKRYSPTDTPNKIEKDLISLLGE